MTPALELRGASVRYGAGRPPALRQVDVQLHAGDSLGIVGESGSGKSTLAKVLCGILRPSTGEALVQGRLWDTTARRDPARRSVQMIFQDPYGALNPWKTALEAVAEVFRFWEGVPRNEASRRAAALLDEMGLSAGAMHRRPHELSGGQCQRVGIARALACDPDVLIADEPTSALDVSVQAQILNLLVGLRQSRGLALVVVSHDLAVVRYMSDDALVMYSGAVVERAPTLTLLESPQHPYTKVLFDSVPGTPGDLHPTLNQVPEGHPCGFAIRCPRLRIDCDTLIPHPRPDDTNRHVACVHPIVAP